MRPKTGRVSVDLSLEPDRETEGGPDQEPGGEVKLEREIDHARQRNRAARGSARPEQAASGASWLASSTMRAREVNVMAGSGHRATPSRHPVNKALVEDAPLGARIADRVTGFMGSWRFIIVQTVIVMIWIGGNIILLFNFDPFPFILLNLAFSTQAAYAAPLILLAGNRQSLRDRMTLEHAASEADIEEQQNDQLLEGNKAISEGNHQILERIEALEQRILDLEKNILARLGAGGTPAS